MSSLGKDRLHGWKEIAAYLSRDERTAKRWEKQRGLPVRRIPGAGRANVYVLLPELEAWLSADSPSSIAAMSGVPASEANQGLARADEAPASLDSLNSSSSVLSSKPGSSQAALLGLSRKGAALLLVVAGGVGGAALLARRFEKRGVSAPAAKHGPYRSLRPEIDEKYLQSLYFFEQRSPQSLLEAKRELLEVISRDPRHALAFAQLANTYLMLHEFAPAPDEETYSEAARAASQAIALDPDLPEAHASLGYLNFFSARDPGSAESHFEEAIRLDPSCALAHLWYGSLLTHQGRYREALDQLNRAQQLQPTSSAVQASRAFALGLSGRREEAVRLLRSLLEADPHAAAPHRTLARLSLLAPRDLDQYLQEMLEFAELRQDGEGRRLFVRARQALHGGGEQALWRSILASERAGRGSSGASTYGMAEAEAQLGQTESSLRDLERLCAKHDSTVMNLGIDPLFAPLRRDPRFGEILASAGLRAASRASGPMPTS